MPVFPTAPDKQALERGAQIAPRFNGDGLIAAIATDAATGEVLMFAWMNAEALRLTLDTGLAHYYSRSRKALWKKGESSGQVQTVEELRKSVGVPGMSIVIVENGKVTMAKGFGVRKMGGSA